jgi:outer membrane immunogenic protein
MKKILLSTVALVSLSAGAMAADLPSRRMAPAPFVAAVPVFTWTGFYVGGNIGYAWRNGNDDDSIFVREGTIDNAPLTEGTFTFLDDHENDGIAGGAQVGFNWQFGSFVVGVEADIQAADLSGGHNGSSSYVFTGVSEIAGINTTTTVFRPSDRGIDWFGTVRARAGFAIDRVLVYATGGFAYGGGGDDDCNGFLGFDCNGSDDTRWGYAVGGGFEWALPMAAGWFGSSAVTFGVEGLYVNLENDGNNNRSFFDAGRDELFIGTNHDDDDFGIVRAKVNFKF